MKQEIVNTIVGKIAVYQKMVPNTVPVIFLHGVYYNHNHNLWNYYTGKIADRTVITVDMPYHGQSKNISKNDWNVDDCAKI